MFEFFFGAASRDIRILIGPTNILFHTSNSPSLATKIKLQNSAVVVPFRFDELKWIGFDQIVERRASEPIDKACTRQAPSIMD